MTFLIHWVPTCWCAPTSPCGRGDRWKTKKLGKLLLNYKGNINRCWITLLIFIKDNQLKAETGFLVFCQRLHARAPHVKRKGLFRAILKPLRPCSFFIFKHLCFALCQWNIDYFQGWSWILFPLSWRNLNWTVCTLWAHVCVQVVINRRPRARERCVCVCVCDHNSSCRSISSWISYFCFNNSISRKCHPCSVKIYLSFFFFLHSLN